MPFSYFDKYNVIPDSNNGSPPTGAPENMAPADVNNAMRQTMAAVAESFTSYSALITNQPSGDDLAPTALPAAAWTYEYADAAQIDVDNAWSVVQNFAPGASAGALNSDNIGLEVRGQTIAQITFNTAGDAGVMQYSEASNISGSGPGEILVDSPFVGGVGYFTSIHAVASVSAVSGVFSGNVSGVDGTFTGNVAGDNVTATLEAKSSTLVVGNPTPPSANGGAIEGDLAVGGTIIGAAVVTDDLQNTGGGAYLSGGATGNYPAETPVQFTASTTAVSIPADRGKLCVASGGVGYTGSPTAGDRFDVFNDTAATISVTGLDDVAGNGEGTGTQVAIAPWQAGSFMRNSANDQWLFVGSGNVS